MAYGPAKPARLPIELIRAMPPAAAAPERKAAGNVQNTGRQPKMPKPATDSAAIFIVGSSSAVDIAMPADATNSGNARWNRRSSLRSERRPHSTMLTSAHDIRQRRHEPGLDVRHPERLHDLRQEEAQPVVGRHRAEIDEAERQHLRVQQRLASRCSGAPSPAAAAPAPDGPPARPARPARATSRRPAGRSDRRTRPRTGSAPAPLPG